MNRKPNKNSIVIAPSDGKTYPTKPSDEEARRREARRKVEDLEEERRLKRETDWFDY